MSNSIVTANFTGVGEPALAQAGAAHIRQRSIVDPALWGLNVDGIAIMFVVSASGEGYAYIDEGGGVKQQEALRLVRAIGRVGGRLTSEPT